MNTPFKMKGMNFGNSPIKQKDFNWKGTSGSGEKILTKQEKAAKQAKHKKSFDARQVSKQKGKDFVKNLKKAGKFIGGKTLGVAGMMSAGTLSATAGNVGKKSEGEQIRDLLTKHKLKGKK